MRFFFDWLLKVLKDEATALKVEASSLEKRANVKAFDKFGEFNVLYALADGKVERLDVNNPDAVFHLEYETCYWFLARRAEEARFQKRLHKIIFPDSDL